MSDSKWLLVLLNIFAMFVVILLGWVARRRAFLSAETTSTLSRFVVDVTLPALVFTSMLRTVDPAKISDNLLLPFICAMLFIVGLVVGFFVMPIFSRKDQRSTFVYLVAAANWIYLPLPIAKALYHDAGERVVLLFNVGGTIVIWTLGVWILRRAKPNWESLRMLFTNPGVIATAAGIILAMTVPAARTLETADAMTLSTPAFIGKTIIVALSMIGGLTIPLTLIVTGAQLGQLDISDHRPSRTLTGVLLARLLLTPVVVIALFILIAKLLPLDPVTRMVTFLIAGMPVAVSCSMFTERFGGDTSLAARSIFYSTLFSIVSVPALFYLIQRLHL